MAEARRAGSRFAITTTPENVTALLQQGRTDGESGFEVLACGDIVQHKKLAPDIYFCVLEKIGLSATDCIALEDFANGLRSSIAAGINFRYDQSLHTQSEGRQFDPDHLHHFIKAGLRSGLFLFRQH